MRIVGSITLSEGCNRNVASAMRYCWPPSDIQMAPVRREAVPCPFHLVQIAEGVDLGIRIERLNRLPVGFTIIGDIELLLGKSGS